MSDYKHFTIVHQLKKRIRIIAPNLLKDQERGYIFQILLLKREAIESVKLVSGIGSVTIQFDPEKLPKANLLIMLESVLHNIGLKPRSSIHEIKRHVSAHQQPAEDLLFGIGGMSCTSCALFLEMMLQREPDVNRASVNYVTETARVNGYLDKERLFNLVADHGYQAFSIDTLAERKLLLEQEEKHLIHSKRRLKLIGLLELPVLLLGMLPYKSRSLHLVQALLSAPVVFLGGKEIFKRAYAQARQGTVNMDSLIAIGAGSAYAYSLPSLFNNHRHVYFDAATGIISFVLLGRHLEELAKQRVVKNIRKLVSLQPQQATRLVGKEEAVISVDEIAIGDILLIRPGEKIPADGIVTKGLSSVDESTVTGSASPCIKEHGSKLFDGCLNGSGVLQMQVTAIGKDTVLSGLVHMVDQAQASKLQIQKTADRLSAVFVPAIIGLSAATFGGWLLAGESSAHAFSNAVSVLLISCPCALGLATPAATMVSSGNAARRGIYIRNSHALETMSTVDTIIFDKTGTLTEGDATVSEFLNISAFEDPRLLQLAASAEFYSEHFLGKAIVAQAKAHDLELLESSHFHSTPDQGIRAQVDGHKILLGNENWMRKQKIDTTALKATAKRQAEHGKTLVYFAIDGNAAGLFSIADQIRPDARQVIEHLNRQGMDTLMVSGDTEQASQHIARQLGIRSVIPEADPAKKLQVIRDLQQQGYKVAMIGDGINDAPALAAADVSLAIGNGTDIAIETADLILVHGEIGKVAESIDISADTLRIIKQNLFWAFAYNGIAIPVAVSGRLNPMIASAAMALSSVSVIVNSLRLNR